MSYCEIRGGQGANNVMIISVIRLFLVIPLRSVIRLQEGTNVPGGFSIKGVDFSSLNCYLSSDLAVLRSSRPKSIFQYFDLNRIV